MMNADAVGPGKIDPAASDNAASADLVDPFADVDDNHLTGATANPVMPDPDEIDERFAERANRALTDAAELRRLIPSHQSPVALIVQGDWTSVRKVFSLSEKYRAWAHYAMPATGFGSHRWLVDQDAPVRLTQAELEAHPQWRGFGTEAGSHPPMRGWLATQIVDSRGVRWGLVQLSDRETGEHTVADEAALVRFADLLSLTLESAWELRNAEKGLAAR